MKEEEEDGSRLLHGSGFEMERWFKSKREVVIYMEVFVVRNGNGGESMLLISECLRVVIEFGGKCFEG